MASTFTASTHACVEFSDGKKSAVPLSCIDSSESDKPRVGDAVEVKWTDGKKYTATITALGQVHVNALKGVITVLIAGGRKQMDSVLATLSDSDEALSSMSILGLNMNLHTHDKR